MYKNLKTALVRLLLYSTACLLECVIIELLINKNCGI